jgi:mediator of RNA polymerase II transcription subunit 13
MLRETCGQCSLLGRWENPLLLSACLVSMETHSTIHVMPASVKTEEEKRSSKIQVRHWDW